MSTTYPDLDVTDPQEPVYDEIQEDEGFIEFLEKIDKETREYMEEHDGYFSTERQS